MSQYAEQIGFAAGVLIGTRVDIAGQGPVRFGILQDASLDFSADLKELYGQKRYAIALAPGKTKVELKAKFAGIRGALFNGFYFGEASTPATQTLFLDSEAHAISAATVLHTNADTASGNVLPFTSTTGVAVGATVTGTNIAAGTTVLSIVANTSVTIVPAITGDVANNAAITFGPSVSVTNQSTWLTDQGVYYAASGLPLSFVPLGTAPAQGQYGVTNGVYVFNPADAAAAVYISYTYSTSSGVMIPVPNVNMGVGPSFSIMLSQPFDGRQSTYTLNNCRSSKLSLPTKQDDFLISELDFQVAADIAGNIGTINTAL